MRIMSLSRYLAISLTLVTAQVRAGETSTELVPVPASTSLRSDETMKEPEEAASPSDLPSADGDPRVSRQDAIDAMAVVEHAVQDANRRLTEGNVKEFATAYTTAIDAVAHAVRAIREHIQSCGAAEAELDFAIAELHKLQQQMDRGVATATWQPKLSEVRAGLLDELRSVYQRHEAIGDGGERQQLRQRMDVLVERLRMLDQWLPDAERHEKTLPVDLERAVTQVSVLREQLAQEQKLIELAAAMMADAIIAARADVAQTLDLLAIQSELPVDLRERLRAFACSVTDSLHVVYRSRETNQSTAQQIADELVLPNETDQGAIVGEAARLLGCPLPSTESVPAPKAVRRLRCPDGSYITIP
ncbi:MAG: hypothetical protein KDA92_13745 [Planctomycetales bacterium]|nr:hypothetical protein [Planctomycetales bacterium]